MLPHLLRRMSLAVVGVFAVALALGCAAGAVRSLPWVASPTVPWSALRVFASLLALAALEVALIVAAPVGLALEAWRLTVDRTASTLHAMGVSPTRIAAHALVVACMVSLGASAVSVGWGSRAPGHAVNRLLRSGGDVCTARKPLSVPLVGVSWLCVGDQPRIVGMARGDGGRRFAWSASEAAFSGDLSEALVGDVRATLDPPRVELRATRARVSGFAPWLAPSSTSSPHRPLAFALLVVLAASVSAWLLIRWPTSSRVLAFLVGSVGPLAFLALADPLMRLQPLARSGCIVLLAVGVPVTLRIAHHRLRLFVGARGGT